MSQGSQPKYQNLNDCLNQIEVGLLKIDDSSMPHNDEGRSLSLDFLEHRERNIELVRRLKKNSMLYELKRWGGIRRDSGYPGYHYSIVDKKGVERYTVVEEYHYPEDLITMEVKDSYNCTRTAEKEDLDSRNIVKENFIIQKLEKAIRLFYEDEFDGFEVTTGTVFGRNGRDEINSVSFPTDNIIELSYSYGRKHGYFKMTDYGATVVVRIPEWEVISNTITYEETYSLG
ncbi:hypothetical protein AUC43_15400 [Hymenobacter sedentarius]|uniref:Uncharacterized protein n=1 Tax=Hymenobacter sedentarius TaxID=1411621 RepID=A0A0U4AZZ1_9BACT|nr:hypothetical protein [Hymenobacter sedentarius]ALW86349.1 hypothetical protein AUC43_15400 [Hymenobacter sedentarius]